MATDKKQITIYDHKTGATIVRDMTAEEIAELPEATDETPSPD
jgi:hypothetical protein